MAFGAGDIVSPHLVYLTFKAQPQPPIFGIIDETGEGTEQVLWEDGTYVGFIDDNCLDKIVAPTADALSGQRVFVDVSPGTGFQQSSDYQGDIIDVFRRDPGGGDSPGPDLVLVKLISSEMYIEALASQVAVVPVGT
jgi:hypothetical protein